MTYWVENRKKGSRNEEIKVEADEPDVQKTESIHISGGGGGGKQSTK